MADETGTTTPTTPAVKPGWKTTEWWLSLAALLLGALMSAGVFASDSLPAKIIGGAIAILATMGYTWSRTTAKKNGGG